MELDNYLIMYQTWKGDTQIETKLLDETVWLTQAQIAEFFQKSRSTITKHISNIFKQAELVPSAVCRKLRHSTQHGAIKGKSQIRVVKYYNLELIISVGYRVRGLQGTRFRKWATARLREYLVKGFAMNDEQLKQMGEGNYFEQLLEELRDIQYSEKCSWRKVLALYGTSIDYDLNAQSSLWVFKKLQNKIDWGRVSRMTPEFSGEPMGEAIAVFMSSANKETKPAKYDIQMPEDNLQEQQENILNTRVASLLKLAESHALNQKPMYMKDWVKHIDDFLELSEQDVQENKAALIAQRKGAPIGRTLSNKH